LFSLKERKRSIAEYFEKRQKLTSSKSREKLTESSRQHNKNVVNQRIYKEDNRLEICVTRRSTKNIFRIPAKNYSTCRTEE
jgi:hypothetical protein